MTAEIIVPCAKELHEDNAHAGVLGIKGVNTNSPQCYRRIFSRWVIWIAIGKYLWKFGLEGLLVHMLKKISCGQLALNAFNASHSAGVNCFVKVDCGSIGSSGSDMVPLRQTLVTVTPNLHRHPLPP